MSSVVGPLKPEEDDRSVIGIPPEVFHTIFGRAISVDDSVGMADRGIGPFLNWLSSIQASASKLASSPSDRGSSRNHYRRGFKLRQPCARSTYSINLVSKPFRKLSEQSARQTVQGCSIHSPVL